MINSKNIIQQGEEAKYLIAIEREGFSMADNDFSVTLSWGMQGRHLTIPKSQMMKDENGQWIFVFSTDEMVGVVTAECVYDVPDGDYPDQFRTEKERQPLCFINTSSRLPQMMRDEGGIYDGRYVSYQRSLRSDRKSIYHILRDVAGNVIRDVNGLVFRVLKNN